MKKLLVAGCLVLVLLSLRLASPSPVATANGWEEVCIRWHVTGEWTYSDSAGVYGVMNFVQDENDNLTGTWQNWSTEGSGSIQGTLNGAHLTFNTHPREQNWSTVHGSARWMMGGYLSTDGAGVITERGTWEATGVAWCMRHKMRPATGSSRVDSTWNHVASPGTIASPLSIQGFAPSNRPPQLHQSSRQQASAPVIAYLASTAVDIETTVWGANLPGSLRVVDVVDGHSTDAGNLARVGTTDGSSGYAGRVAVSVTKPIGSGQTEIHDLHVIDPWDNQLPAVTFRMDMIEPRGYVYDTAADERLEEAVVSLYEKQGGDWALWDAPAYQQTNPLASNADGLYGWEVPEGDYLVRASKPCYLDVESSQMHIPPTRTGVNLGMSPTACSGLQVTEVWTADDAGLVKSRFLAGQPLQQHVVISNTTGSEVSAEVSWLVTDPGGLRVAALSGSATYGLGAFEADLLLDLEGAVPSGAEEGTYQFLASLTHDGQTSLRGTRFTVLGSSAVYLPAVVRNFQTVGPVSLANGDFESGRTGWTEYSLNDTALIFQAADLAVTPHSGSWAVWLGGLPDETAYIEQQVTVPASSPHLAYWHWIASADHCGYDEASVAIDGSTVVDAYDLCDSQDTNGWVKHIVDLSSYAGQTVSLQIGVETDSTFNSNLFIDDVSFQASASSAREREEASGNDLPMSHSR